MRFPFESDSNRASQTADTDVNSQREPVTYGIWPSALIVFGLGLTGVWVCFLGYLLFSLLGHTL
jgi:hypothetical protein